MSFEAFERGEATRETVFILCGNLRKQKRAVIYLLLLPATRATQTTATYPLTPLTSHDTGAYLRYKKTTRSVLTATVYTSS